MKNKETMNYTTLLSVIEWYALHHNVKGVISHDSAANIWGFSETMAKNICITFPSTNLTNDVKNGSWEFDVKHVKPDWRYSLGLLKLSWNGVEYNIYDKERTFIDVYRKYRNEKPTWLFKTCKNFFKNTDYDEKKLYEYATKFNVLHEISLLRGAFNEQ